MAEQGAERRFGEFVVVRRHAYVAELALDRPKAMNAVSTAWPVPSPVRVRRLPRWGCTGVVLTSTHERAFCVGAD